MGLETIGDIARRDPEALSRKLGPSGRDLWEQANAIDPRPVVPDREAKSIGAEDTFDEDLTGAEALSPRVHAQALRVGRRLRAAGLRARTVQLKLKRADNLSGTLIGSRSPRDGLAQAELALAHAYTLVTRRATLDAPTDDGQLLYRTAAALLAAEPARPTRLTGVSAQNLVAADAPQLGLFAPPPTAAQALNRALDAITDRFGAGSVTTADVADDVD
jgi:DNA polymerase-4